MSLISFRLVDCWRVTSETKNTNYFDHLHGP